MGETRLTLTSYHDRWPSWLKKAAQAGLQQQPTIFQPLLVKMGTKQAAKQLEKIVKTQTITEVVDNYDEQLAELYVSENAQLYKANIEVKRNSIQDYLLSHYAKADPWSKGSWVYYPWNRRLVHILEEELFWRLRTIRNSVLLTNEEQSAFRQFRIGCAGMSVGSNGALAIALTSGSQKLKLADGAVFSGSNLNRVRTAVSNIGLNKSVIIAREIYELNPYMQIEAVTQNISTQNIGQFFSKPWDIDLVIDEIDDLETKVRLRLEAKERRLPLIMVTEPGNEIMLDVERYDSDPNTKLFNGLADGIEEVLEKNGLNQREKLKFIAKIIGLPNLPLRDQQAMIKVGATLPSAPQLGSTAMMAGGVIAFAARTLATNPANLKSGRHTISIEKELTHYANSRDYRREHRKHTKNISRTLKSM